MMKIWAKVMKQDKIVKQFVYQTLDNFLADKFYLHVFEICNRMDLPSPLVLPMHTKHFEHYNTTTFKARDYVEDIDFDRFVLENLRSK